MAGTSGAARPAGLGTRSRRAPGGAVAVTTRDALLAGLTFSSGAVDAIAFLALGKVFTAFQTGNLVFLGLGIAGADGHHVVRPALSLVCFAAGVLLGTRIVGRAHRTGPVWAGRVSAALSVGLLAEAAFAVVWASTSGHPGSASTDALLAMSALAMGLQSAAMLSLGVTGVFTTAATATVMRLMRDAADPRTAPAGERSRFAAVLVALVAGATVGGLMLIHARTLAPLLPLVAMAAVIALASRRSRAGRSQDDAVVAGMRGAAGELGS
jgi:uncharacterized membrane protein YoaK (UPF0700 family)